MKKIALLLALLLAPNFLKLDPAQAQQIVPANDGTATLVTPDGQRFIIDGGKLSKDGKNLFHSFREFGLSADQIATFLANPQVRNILSRVVGGNPSYINGLIEVMGGNANLYLVNPAGIVFGSGARLNLAGSFTATTSRQIGFADGVFNAFGANDYLNLVGNPNSFQFSEGSGDIINAGVLEVAPGQNISLLGRSVINTGTISAPGGNITISAIPGTSSLKISQEGQILSLIIEPPRDSQGNPLEVRAVDLPVLLTGAADRGIATGLTVTPAGTVQQVATGVTLPTAAGTTIVSGTVNGAAALGGEIQILGDRVGLVNARIDASGTNGGGTVLIGGDYQGQGTVPNASVTYVSGDSVIKADALTSGNGGRVIVWADKNTSFAGEISARGGATAGDGGFVEISGKENLFFNGQVNTTAPNGAIGTLLLDPENVTIVNGNGGANDGELPDINANDSPGANFTISENALEGLAATTNVVIEATNNITINDLTDNQLTFASPGPGDTPGSITFTANADNLGGGNFSMDASDTIVAPGRNLAISGVNLTIGALNTFSTGNITLTSTGQTSVSGNVTGQDITVTASQANVSGNVTGRNFTVNAPLTLGNAVTPITVNTTANQTYNGTVNLAGVTDFQSGGNFSALPGITTNGQNLSVNAATIATGALDATPTGNITLNGQATVSGNVTGNLFTVNAPLTLGNAITPITVNTVGDQTYSNAVTLAGNVTFSAPGSIAFNNSLNIQTFAANLNADNQIQFSNAGVTGSAGTLNSMTLAPLTAGRGLSFGTAVANTLFLTGLENIGPGVARLNIGNNTTGTITSAGSVNLNTNVTVNAPLTLGPGTLTTVGDQTYNNPVTLAGDVNLRASTSIAFNNSLNIQTFTANLTADNQIQFSNAGVTGNAGILNIVPVTAGRGISLGAGGPGVLSLNGLENIGPGVGQLNIGNTGTGAITSAGPVNLNTNVTFTSGSEFTVNQPLTTNGRNLAVTAATITTGALDASPTGNITLTSTGQTSVSGNVTGQDITVTASQAAASGNVTGRNFTVNAPLTLGNFGNTTSVNTVENQTYNNAVTLAGNVNFTTPTSIAFNNSLNIQTFTANLAADNRIQFSSAGVTGNAGTINIVPLTAGRGISLGEGATSILVLSGLGNIGSGVGQLNIGNTGTGAISSAGPVNLNTNVTFTSANGFTVNQGLTTNGGNLTVNAPSVSTGSIDTSRNTGTRGNITLNAGDRSTVTGNVTGNTLIVNGRLTLGNPLATTLIDTLRDQTYNSPVDLAGNVNFKTPGSIAFKNSLDIQTFTTDLTADNRIEFSNAGVTGIGGTMNIAPVSAGRGISIGEGSIDTLVSIGLGNIGPGVARLNIGDTDTGTISSAGPVNVNTNVTFTSASGFTVPQALTTNGGNFTVNAPIVSTGAIDTSSNTGTRGNITLNAGDRSTVTGDVTGNTLTVNAPLTLGNPITTTRIDTRQNQTYNSLVDLAGNVNFSTPGSIAFNNSLNIQAFTTDLTANNQIQFSTVTGTGGTMNIRPLTNGRGISLGDGGIDTLVLSGLGNISSGVGQLNIGNSGTGAITSASPVNLNTNVTFTSASELTANQGLTTNGGNLTVNAPLVSTGAIDTSRNTGTRGDITLNAIDPATVTGNVTGNSFTVNVPLALGNPDTTTTIDTVQSQTYPESVSLAGNVNFLTPESIAFKDSLDIQTFTTDLTADNRIQLSNAGVTGNGGTMNITPRTSGRGIVLGDGGTNTLVLNGLGNIGSGVSQLNIGSPGTGAISGAGVVNLNTNVTFTSASEFTVSQALTTNGGNLTVNAPIVSTRAIDTSRNTGTRGDITLNASDQATVTGDVTGNSFTVNAPLTFGNGNTLTTLNTTQNQTYNGAITVVGDTDFNAGGTFTAREDITTLGNDLNIDAAEISARNLNSSANQGGNITLNAETSLTAGAINSSGASRGGNVTLTTTEDIEISSINARAPRGSGGTVNVTTQGNIRITDTIDGSNESVSTRDRGRGGAITLQFDGDPTIPPDSRIPFIIGNPTVNGSAGSITSGTARFTSGDIYFTTTRGNVAFISVDSGLTGDNNPQRSVATEALPIEATVAAQNTAITVAQTTRLLQTIEQLTARRPAVIYVSFKPRGLTREIDLERQESDLQREFTTGLNQNIDSVQPSVRPPLEDNQELVIVIVTSEGKSISVPLESVTRQQVIGEAAKLYETLIDRKTSREQYEPPARQLYQWLIKPLEKALEEQKIDNLLFVMPEGLRIIPIAALIDGNGQFLVEKYSSGFAPSLSLNDNTYKDIKEQQLLASGASQFSDPEASFPLEWVQVELPAIANIWGTDSKLINENFTIENLRASRQKNPYGIIHLATHGAFNPGELTSSYIQFYDRQLTLDEVRTLNFNNPPVELLVLSACRTAFGNETVELGFAGLAFKAGVKSVLASLWWVGDVGAPAFMSDFYAKLKSDEVRIKSEALRLTQIDMIRGRVRVVDGKIITPQGTVDLPPDLADIKSPDLTHPYFWAPFTLIGNPW